jgi:hypothetical protein
MTEKLSPSEELSLLFEEYELEKKKRFECDNKHKTIDWDLESAIWEKYNPRNYK